MGVTVPNQTVAIAEPGGLPTPDFRRWQLAITSAVNTPTVAPPIEPVTGDFLPLSTYVKGTDRIEYYGSLATGGVSLGLGKLADTATGTFQLIDARDPYGCITGVADGTAADVPYDNATSGLAADNVQAAIDELSAEKLDDAPSDGTTYGRKDGGWSAITSGGGGADPSTTFQRVWDFADGITTSANNGTSFVVTAGVPVTYTAGAGASASYITPTADAPCLVRMACAATGSYARTFFTPGPRIMIGGGEIDIYYRLRIPALSNSTDRFSLSVGLLQVISGASTDAINVTYTDNTNSGHWTLNTNASSNSSSTSASVGPAANTLTTLRLNINAAGTLVTLYVDGTSEATINTNIPTAALGVALFHNKTAGSNSCAVDIDYVAIKQAFTTPR